MPQYENVTFVGHGDVAVNAPESPSDPPGIWGPTDPRPTPPIVIPPGWLGNGVPTHPIVLPPPRPEHPIVIPPDAVSPGVPAHPIVLPPYVPAHPIVIPPDSLAPGVPTHPIYLPPLIWGGGNVPMPTPPIFLPPASELPGDAINLGVFVLYQWDGKLVLVPVGEVAPAKGK